MGWGGIEKDTGHYCFIEVLNRCHETLLLIIQQWILHGSRIISHGWAAYAKIEHIDDRVHMHDTVIHTRSFVHPNTEEANTQKKTLG